MKFPWATHLIVTGDTKESLENDIKPAVANFLKERGLELSIEKTMITHIDDGFNFLGFNVRKYQGKLLIKPSKESINTFLKKIRYLIKINLTTETCKLIEQLNSKIIGWALYYRHSVAKQVFGYIDDGIYRSISRWTIRRHDKKNMSWIRKKYFHRSNMANWIFFGIKQGENGEKEIVDLVKARSININRHVKVKQEARLYDPKIC